MKSPEAYLLRAEELRVIASESKRPEIRNFLLGIVKDYESLAGSARFMRGCEDRLTSASSRLETVMAEIGPTKQRGFASDEDTSETCRSLAADAREMATRAGSLSQDAWLQLAERWKSLAETIGRAAEDEDLK